jgi:hypothetical protein
MAKQGICRRCRICKGSIHNRVCSHPYNISAGNRLLMLRRRNGELVLVVAPRHSRPLSIRCSVLPTSFNASVGVPPEVLTVTASLNATVSVTTLPAFRLPLPFVIPAPDATTEETVGGVLSILMVCGGCGRGDPGCRCKPALLAEVFSGP